MNELYNEWRSFLNEGRGRSLEKVTTFISREIVYALKDEGVRSAFLKTEPVTFYLTQEFTEVEWLRSVIVSLSSNEEHVYTHANYEYDLGATDEQRKNSDMNVNIVIPRNYDNSVLSELIPDLKDSIRHELEHSIQSTEMLTVVVDELSDGEIWKSLGTAKNYYTSEAETKAHVAGLYKKAKILREPFGEVLDRFLAEVWQTGMYHRYPEEKLDNLVLHIRELYRHYAASRYPNVEIDWENGESE